MLYSSSTENCETSDLVTECSVIVAAATDTPLPTTSLLRATRPATTTNTPVLVDDTGMWVPDSTRISSTQPQVVYDGHNSVAVVSTVAAVESTPETPVLVDDKDMWVPDSTHTSSTTPQVVIDGPDAVAPSTTVPGSNVVTTTPKVVYDGTDATAIWSTTEASNLSSFQEYYTPLRSKKSCISVYAYTNERKKNLRRLPSVWDALYPTKDACCDAFSFNQKHYDRCINDL
jgi:hypothetical protein